MTLEEQIEFLQTIEKRFIDLDRMYLKFDTYDGHYAVMAEQAGEVMESIHRLIDLEK